MKICVVSCSPKGEISMTLQAERFLEKWFKNDEFTTIIQTKGNLTDELKDTVSNSDLVLFLCSVFHFDIHSNMMKLLDKMVDSDFYDVIKEKPVTFMSTSGQQGDNFAHNVVMNWATRNKLKWINSLSLHLSGLLRDEHCEELYCWFNYVRSAASYYNNKEIPTIKMDGRVMLVDTTKDADERVLKDIEFAKNRFKSSGFDVDVLTIRDYNIKTCTGCMAGYSNRRCFIKDDWHDAYNKLFLNNDMIIYFGNLHYSTLGDTYKTFLERQACMGRCGLDDECIKGYFVHKDNISNDGDFTEFRLSCQAFEGLSGAYLSDVIDLDKDYFDLETSIDKMTIAFNNRVMPQTSFLSNAMNRNFAAVAKILKNQCPGDYKFFEDKGLYRPIETEAHAKWIDDAKGAVEQNKSHLIPYKMKLLDMNGVPKVHDRRTHKSEPIVERHMRLVDEVHGTTGDAGTNNKDNVVVTSQDKQKDQGLLNKIFGKKK